MPDLHFSSVLDQAAWVNSGQLSARQLVEHSLERIEALNPTLNAFHVVLAHEALAVADQLDVETAAGTSRGPLHGVPLAIKEENDIAGIPTTFGTGANLTPATADSVVVERLRSAGAIIIGSTRMPEFGLWPYTESVSGGWTRNPWNPEFSPCGSSGGTAAAVASGMVAAGIGGDGGGSIRLPASWCGLFGLKPQRGRVSTSPASDLWRSLGTVGPITRTVADSALIYDVLAGHEHADRFRAAALTDSFSSAIEAAASGESARRLRIAVSAKNPSGGPRPNEASRDALTEAVHALRELGHDVVQIDPHYPAVSAEFILQVAGGARDEVTNLDAPEKLEQRTRDLLRLTKPLEGLGTWAERSGMKKGREFLSAFFSQYDLLMTPTTPTEAQPVGQLDGLSAIRTVMKATPVASYTSIWNVIGNPAAAVPMGFTDAGLPRSVQIVGPADGELTLLRLCAELEQLRPWAHHHPAI
ncbi:MAG: amidase [Microbacteriaceae bacterium]|nr:amidase [Microbacteriaceae bacterium]